MEHSTTVAAKVVKLSIGKSSIAPIPHDFTSTTSHQHDTSSLVQQSNQGFHGSGKIDLGSHGIDVSGSVSYSGAHGGGFNGNFDYSCHSDFNIGGYIKF